MLGYLDDLVITPLGLVLAVKLIPPRVLAEAREQAALAAEQGRLTSRVGAAVVVGVWALGVLLPIHVLLGMARSRALWLPSL